MLVVDKAAIDGLNRVDEAITFATLPAFKPVVEGEMIATVKIIPFATSEASLKGRWPLPASRSSASRPTRSRRSAWSRPCCRALPTKVVEKTLRVMQDRLTPAGASIVAERRVPHEQGAVAKAVDEVLKEGAELVVVFGASAIADRRDVIPAAVEAIGGRIEHFGMPVDPGNLMLIGQARGQPILGAPGCARSPKENGFDWILMRLLAGLAVSREDVTGFGVGGLLMEIVTRPQPRAEPEPEKAQRIAAVLLAAGRSTRMGGPNKLLAEIGGRPLVRIAAEAGAGLARPSGDRGDRPSARQGRGGAARPRCASRAQSEFRRGAFDLGEDRTCGCARDGRWRHRLPRRHAAGERAADRQARRPRSIPSAARWW